MTSKLKSKGASMRCKISGTTVEICIILANDTILTHYWDYAECNSKIAKAITNVAKED